jgi:ABC-type dipeptide/oligopeptide/nickel transport system permease component
MARYAAERLLAMVPTVLALSLVLFVLMRLTPGSPLQPDAPNANPLGPEAQVLLAREWGLDKPILVQYGRFVERAVQLDFGTSYYFKTRQVMEILPPLVPVSLHLGLMALAVAVVGGGALGVLAAVHQNRPLDHACTLVATLGVAVPNFVVGVLLIALFVLGLGVVPRTGGWESPADWVLPTVALALGPLGILARHTRASMVEVLRSDYVRTARAKGLRERRVVLVHALRNGLIAPLTVLGPISAAVLTGSPFVETIFRVPGIGRYFVESILARDYPVIMAVFLFYGIVLQLATLTVDVLHGVVDPRIRLGGSA